METKCDHYVFFFSSRRRHTRLQGDWSSDVCSSDLALYGTVNAFDMPIRQSFTVEMVGQEDVTSAVALNSSVFNGTRIVGPAVAGILIATVGLAACFFLNAISYIAVVASLLMMDKSQ